MARMVQPSVFRDVMQYKDSAGHRLPSDKGEWEVYRITVGLPSPPRECSECPPAEPEPAKVDCDAAVYHQEPMVWFLYCPRCGVRLPEA